MKRTVLTFLLTLMVAAEAAGAASLLDYEKRVFRAAEQVERIKADKEYGDEGADYIKRLLPKTEHVSAAGRDVVVDNGWLHGLLDSYAAEADQAKRLAILNEAGGSLKALDEHLREAEDESSATVDKDDSREKLRQILSQPEYRKKREDPIAAFIKRIMRRVREFFVEIYTWITQALFGAGGEGHWLFRVMIIAAIAGAVIAAARVFKPLKRRKKRQKKQTVLGEEIEEGASSRDLADAALAAARAGDFRTAVRKLYVSFLYELAERNLIELESNATNREYLQRVTRFAPLRGPMGYLTDRFDYFWYGMFPSTEEDFSDYLATYMEAMERARNLGERPATL